MSGIGDRTCRDVRSSAAVGELRTFSDRIRSVYETRPTPACNFSAATAYWKEGFCTSAADLKFLHHLQQTLLGTSNRKAALES